MSADNRSRAALGGSLLSLTLGAALCTGVVLAPVASAATAVEQAVAAARGASSCGPLRNDAAVQQAADIMNRSTRSYLNHTSGGHVPSEQPQPIALLKDVGVETDTAMALQGAGRTEHDAIKGALLQGYKAIKDCAYTEIGTSLLYEEQTGFVLAVAVLVGR